MAAPGTLIPADVLSLKDTSSNPKSKNMSPSTSKPEEDHFKVELLGGEHKGGNEVPFLDESKALDKRLRYEKSIVIPSVQSDCNGESSTTSGALSGGNMSLCMQDQPDQSTSSTSATCSKQKGIVGAAADGDNTGKRKVNMALNPQNAVDSTNLFAELNPLRVIGVGQSSPHSKATDSTNGGYQRRSEKVALGPGRSQVPLIWKGRSACNEIRNTKQNNIVELSVPQRNHVLNASSSKIPSPAAKVYSGGSTNVAGSSISSNSVGVISSANQTSCTSLSIGYSFSECVESGNDAPAKNRNHELDSRHFDLPADKSLVSVLSSGEKYLMDDRTRRVVSEMSQPHELNGHVKNINEKHDPKKCSHDRFLETIFFFLSRIIRRSVSCRLEWNGELLPMVTGTRTARYRAVPPKIDRRPSIEELGRLREKKGRRRRRRKEEKRRGEEENQCRPRPRVARALSLGEHPRSPFLPREETEEEEKKKTSAVLARRSPVRCHWASALTRLFSRARRRSVSSRG
ncbi:hypothetical protein B296_00048449, partial [Ensete ventricosum]